jgi:holliday junction DNA helicase RuvA
MIAYLSGKILYKSANVVILDVQGVGYEAQIPVSTYGKIGELGAVAALQIVTHLREDALLLFGFATWEEKELFKLLVSVSGIGPRLALSLLSGLTVLEIVAVILENNVAKLTSVPGIGKKTAERLILELKDKVRSWSPTTNSLTSEAGKAGIAPDVVSALVNLGWPAGTAEKAVTSTLQVETRQDFEWILKQALKRLYR